MAAGGGGSMSQGPTPWWQLPEYQGKLDNLKNSAPPGYEYDPIKMAYVKTPTAQGSAVKQYNDAANPALSGLLSSIGSTFGAGGGATAAPAGGGSFSGSGASTVGSGGGTPSVGGGGGYVPPIKMPDMSRASDAAFATSKDRAGKIGRSMIDSLRGELGATGNLGGGAEVQGIKDIATEAGGVVGQASRDQAIKEADLGADFAKTGYQGSITQRGQDISAQEANARLAQEKELQASRMAFEQQSLKSQQQLQLLQLALSGLKGGGAAGGGLEY